jgi:multicomponent Na+:H+ antiporter subunit F
VFAVTTAALIVTIAMALARAFLGPTVYDRILAVNSFGTKTVLLIAALGFLAGRPDFLDIALLYALVNFIGTLAVLKFVRYRTFGDAAEQDVPATPATVKAEKS